MRLTAVGMWFGLFNTFDVSLNGQHMIQKIDEVHDKYCVE